VTITPPERGGPSSWGWTAGGLALVAALGIIDAATGPDVGFSLFYLVPISAAGWFIGRRSSVLLAAASAVAWFVAESGWGHDYSWHVSVWNGATRLVIYLGAAILLSALARSERRLTELAAVEARLARTDVLTGLGNLRALNEETLARRGADFPGCALYVDIDNFKQLNDAYGHTAGDEFLRLVGRSIAATIRSSDLAVRLGGDEFAILLGAGGTAAGPEVAQRIINSVQEAAAAFPRAPVSASVGLACAETSQDQVEDLLRRADAAMYEAKTQGKARIGVWHPAPEGSQPA
jgi:diguanylate cyclase (GGDEF)-like protein